MGNRSIKIYDDSPHDTVSYDNSFDEAYEDAFDLESGLQFVSDGHAVRLDFSVFGSTKRENAQDAKDELDREVQAFNALRMAVEDAHLEFLDNARQAYARLRVALDAES